MPFKTNSDGSLVMQGKLPVFIDSGGKEEPFDPDAATKTIGLMSAKMRRGAFSESKYLAEKSKMHPAVLETFFGEQFKIEDGEIVGYHKSGAKIYSLTRYGETANFDEAIEQMIGAYEHRSALLKEAGAPAAATGQSGGKAITRAQHDAMTPIDRARHFTTGGTMVDDEAAGAPAVQSKVWPVAPAPGSTVTRAQFDALPPAMRARSILVDRIKLVD